MQKLILTISQNMTTKPQPLVVTTHITINNDIYAILV